MSRDQITPPDDSNDYFLEIESQFARVRGTSFVFSSKDWLLMKQWREEGVPLPIVLEAIETCFTKKREGGRRKMISSLSYCRHAVDELWSERKDLYVGKGDAVPENDPTVALTRLATELRAIAAEQPEALARVLGDVAQEIEALPQRSVPELEQRLLEMEETLLANVVAALPEETRREVDAAQSAITASDDKVAERMRSANLKRLIRKQLALPRLSLF